MKSLIQVIRNKFNAASEKFINQRKTYLEFSEEEIQIVQLEGNEVIYDQVFKEGEELSYRLKRAAYYPDQVTVLIPPVKAFNRVLDLPAAAEERIDEIIQFQFLDDLPCTREEVYYTYHLALAAEERIKVLAFAVLKDYINNLRKLCKEADLSAVSFIPAGLIFYLLHQEENKTDQSVLYLDRGPGYYNYTFLAPNDIYLRGSKEKELESTLFYLSREHEFEIGSLFSEPEEGLEDLKGIKVNKNRDRNFWLQAEEAEKKLIGKELTTISEQEEENIKRNLGKAVCLAVVILLLNFGLRWKLNQQRLKNLQQKIRRADSVVERINEMRNKTTSIQNKVEGIKEGLKENQGYLPWINELGKILPEDVVITQLNFTEDKLALLSGTAPSASEVMTKLEQSPYFKNLNFSGSIVTQNNKERFKIVGELTNERAK